ncbi:MAG: hypothetical protein PUG33_00240 [Mollicutes bacterium]|nr:hypothetical protein [Mollicutes bacterium]
MAMMKNYEVTSGGGPIFNKPACSVSYPYSSNTKNAADISSVWDYIDGILSSISSLSNDFESIKNKIRSLEDNWNNCIIMNGVGNEYVYVDDVNGDITNFSSKCESGKVEVDGIFSEFSGTIAEINEYMNLLKENYANYQSLQSELISASSELSALSVSNSNSINTSRISTLNSTIASLKNKMKDYQEITSIDSCGKWVEK